MAPSTKVRAAAAGLAAIGLSLISLPQAFAADHNDSPLVQSVARSYVDVTDVFVFRSPDNNDRLSVIVGFFSPEVAATAQQFRTDARYETYIDTDGDFRAEHTIRTTFSPPDANGVQTYLMDGIPGNSAITGSTTVNADTPSVQSSGSARTFAGLADDPFFFDLEAFQAFVANPCVPAAGLRCPGTGNPVDFFAGRNIAAIAVDFPITSLRNVGSTTSGVVRVWAKAFEQNQ